MLPKEGTSLWSRLSAVGERSERFLFGADATFTPEDLIYSSRLGGRVEELRGRSVLVSTKSQLNAATTLIELDGLARRIVLCPPDLSSEHLPYIIESSGADAIVSDGDAAGLNTSGAGTLITCGHKIVPASCDRTAPCQTEWVLLTSGTTGRPKLVVHTLASLAGVIQNRATSPSPVVWSTFYDIRRYGGLQIFLRAILTGTSLILSSAQESTPDFLARAGAHGVTHISGTPSHWRHALMSPSAHLIAPRYIRLSGEIADQAILNHLRSFYPNAEIAHAFASTEAGVAFDVTDGLAGFPASLIGKANGVEMKVEGGSLRIRSSRVADRYLGNETRYIVNADGFVDTGDMVDLLDDRYYFVGRRDGVINIGGLKVHPEEVEAVINRHPQVQMSLVRTRKNPITGALVVAKVVLKAEHLSGNGTAPGLRDEILQICRGALSRHKIPTSIEFVTSLPVAATGKLMRDHA